MWDIFGEQILEAKIKQNVYKKGTEISSLVIKQFKFALNEVKCRVKF